MPDEEKTQEAYNLLVQKSEKIEQDANRINGIQAQAQERLKSVFSDLSFNVIDGTFDTSFKNLDAYKDWVDKHVKEDRKTFSSTLDNLGTFVQESIRTIKDASIGTGLYLYNASGINFDKGAEYSFKDAINVAYQNTDKYNWLGTSEFNAELTDKDGNYNWDNAGRAAGKSIARTLPFMLGIMLSGGRTAPAALTKTKGPISGLANLQSLAHRSFGGGKSPAAMRNLSMMETTYRMTVLDNY